MLRILGIFVSSSLLISGLVAVNAPLAEAEESEAESVILDTATNPVKENPSIPIEPLTELITTVTLTDADTYVITVTGNTTEIENTTPVSIINDNTKETLALCMNLSECSTSTTVTELTYFYAQSGSVVSELVPTDQNSSARTQTETTTPSTSLIAGNLTLESSYNTTFSTEQGAQANALFSEPEPSGKRIYIFDITNDVLKSTGATVTALDVKWDTGDKSRNFKAFLADGDYSTAPTAVHVGDLTGIVAESNVITFTRKPWTITLEQWAMFNSVEGKYKVTSLGSLNQRYNWYGAASPYLTVIFNVTTQKWATAYGDSCCASTDHAGYFDLGPYPVQEYVAYVGLPIRTNGVITGVNDIQAVSNTSIIYHPLGDAASTIPAAKYKTQGGSNLSSPCYQECAADPINTLTGEYYENEIDIADVTNLDVPLNFTRTYSSQMNANDRGLGFGWRHNYDIRLNAYDPATGTISTYNPNTSRFVEIQQENGSTVTFTRIGGNNSSIWVAPDGVQAGFESSSLSSSFWRPDGTFVNFRTTAGTTTWRPSEIGQVGTGHKLSFIYNSANGNLTQIQAYNNPTTQVGTINITWSGTRITQVQSGATTLSYAYVSPSVNTLASVTVNGATTPKIRYTYNTARRITEKKFADNTKVTNVYGAGANADKVLSQTNENNQTTGFIYSAATTSNAGKITQDTKVTNPDGTIRHSYYADGRVVKTVEDENGSVPLITQFQYTNGFLTKTTNPNNSYTSTTYDSMGNVLTTQDELGNTTTYTYRHRGFSSYKRVPLSTQVATITDAKNNTTTFTYRLEDDKLEKVTDAEGNDITFEYNVSKLVSKVISPMGAEQSATYDNRGYLLQQTAPEGNAVTYSRNSENLVTSVTDANNNTTEFEYDSRGNQTKTIDPADNETLTFYNSLNFATSSTNALSQTASVTYDNMGNPLVTTYPNATTTSTTYDSMNRPITSTDANGNVTTYTYDGHGNLRKVKNALNKEIVFTYNWRGQVVNTLTPEGKTSSNTYDLAGRLLTSTDGEGKTTTYTYDTVGNNLSVKDPENRITSFAYSATNKLITVTRPDMKVESYVYNDDGYLIQRRDAENNVSTYTVDELGRTVEANELGIHKSYTYDNVGNLLEVKNLADNSTINYEYDNRNLLTHVTSSDNLTDYEYSYDDLGRRVTATDEAGITTYEYNIQGLLHKTLLGTQVQTEQTYDNVGNLRTLKYPNGDTVSYTYDALSRMTAVDNVDAGTVSYAYNDDNELTTTTWPNGVVSSYEYNNRGQTSHIDHSNTSSVIAEYDYSYTNSGLLSQQNISNGTTQNKSFTYDALSRMAQTTKGSTIGNFVYNDIDTITGLDDGTTFTTNASQQITNSVQSGGTDTDYTYDTRGNRTNSVKEVSSQIQEENEYTYNVADRLVQANLSANPPNAQVIEKDYEYNHNGLLSETTTTENDNSSTEEFTWLIAGIPLLLSDATSNYIYGSDNSPIAQVDKSTNEATYYLTDQLGSIRTAVDDAGAVVARFDYSEYGQDLSSSSTRTNIKFGYAGEYLDTDTGFYNLRARWYDPDTAQFTSVDPLVYSTHLAYGYTAGNPLQYVDPLGLDFWADAGQFGLGALDGLTGGISTAIIDAVAPGVIDKCNSAFTVGSVVGTVASFFIPGGAVLKTVGTVAVVAFAAVKSITKIASLGVKAYKSVKSSGIANKIANKVKTAWKEMRTNPERGSIGGSTAKNIPVFKLEYGKGYDEVIQHHIEAFAAGHPQILTKTTVGVKSRRGKATRPLKTMAGKERDEYPYASTVEGGSGASVKLVTKTDNGKHGRALLDFYLANGMQGPKGNGMQFRVELP